MTIETSDIKTKIMLCMTIPWLLKHMQELVEEKIKNTENTKINFVLKMFNHFFLSNHAMCISLIKIS